MKDREDVQQWIDHVVKVMEIDIDMMKEERESSLWELEIDLYGISKDLVKLLMKKKEEGQNDYELYVDRDNLPNDEYNQLNVVKDLEKLLFTDSGNIEERILTDMEKTAYKDCLNIYCEHCNNILRRLNRHKRNHSRE